MDYRKFAGRLVSAFICALAAMSAPVFAQQAAPTILEYRQTSLKGFVAAEFSRDAAGCQRICEQRSGCTGFDHSSTNMCRIFAAVSSAEADPTRSAGTRTPIPGYRAPSNLPEPAPPAVEQAQWHFAKFSNVDFYGGDIVPKGIEANNPATCERVCDDNLACRAFTFNAEQKRCFLKNGHQFVQTAKGVTSGLYFKAKPSEARLQLNAEWDLFLTSDFPNHDLGEYPASSYEQCMTACEGMPYCAGFTWIYSGRDRCYLKSGPGLFPVGNRKGMVSASKADRSVYPDFVRAVAPRD